MSDKSAIEWTDATWNPVRGCTKVSSGCKNCYAETFAERWRGVPGHAFEQGFDLRLVPEKLGVPLHWRRPRRIFVNSMSDLFHEKVENNYIAAVFGVMAACPQHTFQVLTKRAERMRSWFECVGRARVTDAVQALALTGRLGERAKHGPLPTLASWPLPNVWIGVSVENQQAADERIPHLLHVPAAVRFLSCEPLLGPLELSDVTRRSDAVSQLGRKSLTGIDWVIVGGESGAGARQFEVAWARSLVKQCESAGVRCFVKQVGAFVVDRNDVGFEAENEVWAEGPQTGQPVDAGAWPTPLDVEDNINGYREEYQGAPVRIRLRNRKGGDWNEWPADLRVREFPEVRR